MKGEYVGQDGRTYRWRGDDCTYVITRDPDGYGWFGISAADWPAAKAALDELLSEREEWVEVVTPTGAIYRFTPEGECKQSRYKDGASWHKEYWPAADCIAKAFLQVRDEAVRELKDIAEQRPPFNRETMSMEEWADRVWVAAKRVKL